MSGRLVASDEICARDRLVIGGPITSRNVSAPVRINADVVISGKLTCRSINTGIQTPEESRRNNAYALRVDAAQEQYLANNLPEHTNNGDEELYPTKIGNFSKGLQHNNFGEVNLPAYAKLTYAVSSGRPTDFSAIPTYGPRQLTNPQAGYAYDLEGADAHALVIPPAPSLSSAWRAGEACEVYWMSMLREVLFTDFSTDPSIAAACVELNGLSDYRGTKPVTPDNIFRCSLFPSPGPYVSQFLLAPVNYGANTIDQKMHTPNPVNFMTDYNECLAIQNGQNPTSPLVVSVGTRYLINGRDLGQWVHVDVLYQAYHYAMLRLLQTGAPYNPGNPYTQQSYANQMPFGTFGGPHVATLLPEVATRALKAEWYQKWCVHRTLRPEAYGILVQHTAAGSRIYPVHDDILTSTIIQDVFNEYGTYLLPQAYPEGSPLHPAYGSGHATVAGACVTILKAFFDGEHILSDPVIPDNTGDNLIPYVGVPLTVHNELNKLASNIAFGRNYAGVHWRSDAEEAMLLGESVAIEILRDQRKLYNETFGGFTFTKFDGSVITI